MKILVIEDDKFLADSISMNLTKDGYVTDKTYSGKDGSYLARVNKYDIIILDYYLGDLTGINVIEEVRESNKSTKIIILSGEMDTNIKVRSLDAGADDYVTKPFSYSELISRIKTINRRSDYINEEKYIIGDLYVDLKRNIVKRSNKNIILTSKEFGILELLLKSDGIIVSRSELMEKVWKKEADPFSNTIESHIVNLRKKINLNNSKRNIILSCHGKGYRIDSFKNADYSIKNT